MSKQIPTIGEHFEAWSQNYERMTGGATRSIARYLLSISPPITSESVVLDNACGPGILTSELIQKTPTAQNIRINAVDFAPSMVQMTEAMVKHQNWNLVETAVMDAQELTFNDSTFTHSYTNFGIFFLPDAVRGAHQIHRTLKDGGTAFITSWAHMAYLPLMRKAEKAVRPDLTPFEWPVSEEWFQASHLEKVLREGGFTDVSLKQEDTFMKAPSIDALSEVLGESFGKLLVGWTAENKQELVTTLKKFMEEDTNVTEKGDGAAIRMIANIAIARK